MSTVRLPDELVDRLTAEAARRGITVDDLAAETLDAQFPERTTPAARPRRNLAFVAIGSSGKRRGAAAADELLAEGFGRD